MRILLVALNARYVHTNLAIRCLREALEEQREDWEVRIKEFSINDHLENIAAEVYEEKPDIIGFSYYIWNITPIMSLVRRLRQVLPLAYFVAGGPEVSFDPEETLRKCPQLDAVIAGEGELSFPDLVRAWSEGQLPWQVKGIVWRFQKPGEHKDLRAIIPPGFQGKYLDEGSAIIFWNKMCTSLPDLNRLPNPYTKEEDFQGRLVYVETSRGCPFSCQFCISSTSRGMRYLDPERFRLSLRRLLSCGARTIKFVDRTFNARKQHAFRILDVFREEAEKILPEAGSEKTPPELPRAHCEMAGELLDKDWLDYLQNFPRGMIQLEIGVQSTHQPTLEAVQRPQNFSLWKDKVSFLQHTCNIPVHLDLIAGLPLESWPEFQNSFNEVFALRPNNLQLGFLKVLKGSGLWARSSDYGLVYSPDPPYTILKTRELTHGEILALSRLEEILEKYYNSGRFPYSLEYTLKYISDCIPNESVEETSPFDFFHSFAEYWQRNGWFKREWNPKALFENLWHYLQEKCNSGQGLGYDANLDFRAGREVIWREALRFDYYLLERPGQVPAFLQGHYTQFAKEMDKKREEIKNDPYWQEVIPEAGKLDKQQWARATAVEYFTFDILQSEQAAMLLTKEKKQLGAWYLFYYQGKERRFFKYNSGIDTLK